MSEAARIMAHMIPFFPDLDTSTAVVEGLIDGGVTYLEVQFPFSDPSADGPAIQAACSRALKAGFSVRQGFEFLSQIQGRFDVPVFLMTYASIPVSYGVQRFAEKAAECGVTGIIAPDLPPDYDEGLYAAAESAGISVVPVLAPSVTDYRIALARERQPRHVYAALRRGITGQETSIGAENLAFLRRLEAIGAPIVAGFGVRRREQVRALEAHVDAVVVGSLLVEEIAAASAPDAARSAVRRTVAELAGLEGAGVS